MNFTIKEINYYPIKSLSPQRINICRIKKNSGMDNDRIFAFSRGVSPEIAKLIQEDPKKRKLNNFLCVMFQACDLLCATYAINLTEGKITWIVI